MEKKTALQEALGIIDKNISENNELLIDHYRDDERCAKIQAANNQLIWLKVQMQSLLPREREQIEEAYLMGEIDEGLRYEKSEANHKNSSNYYTNTYTNGQTTEK